MEFPAIEASEELQKLSDKIATLAHELKLMRNTLDLIDHDLLAQKIKTSYREVAGRAEKLGHSRVLRILRLGVPPVRGIDANCATRPSLEDAILWSESIFRNIDTELRRIDSERILWLSLMATIAGIASVVTAVCQNFCRR